MWRLQSWPWFSPGNELVKRRVELTKKSSYAYYSDRIFSVFFFSYFYYFFFNNSNRLCCIYIGRSNANLRNLICYWHEVYFRDTPYIRFSAFFDSSTWFEHDKGLTYAGLHLRERRCIRREVVPIRSLGQCLGLSEGSRSKQYRRYPDTLGIMERNVLGISHEVSHLIFRFIVVPSFPYLPYFPLKTTFLSLEILSIQSVEPYCTLGLPYLSSN